MAQLKSTTIYGDLTIDRTDEGCSWLEGQNHGTINIQGMINTNAYWPWISGTNTASSKMFSIGVSNNDFYIVGSSSSRADNGYDSYVRLNIGENRFYAKSVVTDDWFRSTGNSGWYSQTYGGGWYMTDTNFIRSFANKGVYTGSGEIRTDGIFTSRHNDTPFIHTHGSSGCGVGFGVGDSGTSHGVYSRTQGKWIIYAKKGVSNKVYSGFATSLTSSDKRLKTQLNLIQPNKYYNVLDKLKPFSYKFIDGINEDTYFGFMAQDIERIFAEEKLDVGSLVDEVELEDSEIDYYVKKLGYNPLPDKKRKSVAYTEFIPILWSFAKYHKDAINELRIENDRLKKEIDDIKSKMED